MKYFSSTGFLKNQDKGSRPGIDRPYSISQIWFMACFYRAFKLRMLLKFLKGYEKGEEEEGVSETLYGRQILQSLLSVPLEKKWACLYSRSCSELCGDSFGSCPRDIRTIQ